MTEKRLDTIRKTPFELLHDVIANYIDRMNTVQCTREQLERKEFEICVREMEIYDDLRQTMHLLDHTYVDGVREQSESGTLGHQGKAAQEAKGSRKGSTHSLALDEAGRPIACDCDMCADIYATPG